MIYAEMAVAVLAIVFTVLPARGLIGRNRLVGIRTRATLQSDTAWRRGHSAAVLPMALTGGAVVVAGLVLIGLGHLESIPATIVLAIVVLVGALWSAGRASRAAS
ncbi:SdpI family protein [Curtobacterium sp. RRHDQ10]|uniref:SdpI family protein n=1 Tax=Curtobacterium phyllosphaerae TaxID=3413379 RepID=UPI003BF07D66